jgi:uncharacterized protein YgbK (DUF1537 family)
MATKTKIIKALRDGLDAELVDGLDTVRETKRVMGFVASKRFKNLDHAARQKLLWKIINSVDSSPRNNIGPIVTMTLEEAQLHTAETD